ncbi:hypothetical protein P154DRAFT_585650 [Amniculicola lignicola CBS 123094]|uniref:CFEM domain-containing protein n=1 Tax=Amniculicola lignicola CBS 123094 TaxID=1392246 RepID=A0A6A5W5W0_9PLEO|nr:hypothetical protein P154DRAFT_585650 [Amniculicola lignicola CBS 123094]
MLVAGVGAQQSSALTIGDIPSCGLQCILYNLPASGCQLSDTACLCHSTDFTKESSVCMLGNCTMADSLVTAKVQASICNLRDSSKTINVLLYTSIVYSITAIFVILRCWAKIASKRISPDDYLVVACLLLTAISLGCVIRMTQIGFGDQFWMLKDGQLLENLRLFYVAWTSYVAVLGLLKVALLLFYLQIFPSRGFSITAYVIMSLVIASSSTIFFLTIFACNPVKAFWDRDIKGKCMDINLIAYANSVNAIVQDVVILILPLPWVFKLNMQRWRKIAVTFMFSVGIFGTITTILRLRSLLIFHISVNPTWDYVPVTVWTELELGCIFVCLCLPSVRILLVRILPAGMLASLKSRTRSRSSRKSDKDKTHGVQNATAPAGEQRGPGAEEKKRENTGFTWLQVSQGSTGSGSNMSKRGSRTSKSRSVREIIKVWIAPWAMPSAVSQDRSHYHSRIWSLVHDIPNDGARRGGERDSDIELMCTTTDLEMGNMPKPAEPHLKDDSGHPKRMECNSCGSESDVITALPQVGFLPDRSYSYDRSTFERTRMGSVGGRERAMKGYHAV